MNDHIKTHFNTVDSVYAIRSFVLRQGRMTVGQKAAVANLWKIYGLSVEKPFNALEAFGPETPDAPLVVEIGFGMGHSLLQMAKANPEKNYIGIEVHQPGVGALMASLAEEKINNVRIYAADAVLVLKQCFLPETLSEVLIYFPDPWPKKRQQKRRIIQPAFTEMVVNLLKPNGILHCATDWEDYAYYMMAVLSSNSYLQNTIENELFSPRPAWRPETKFELRGQRLGHQIYDLIFRKKDQTNV